MEHQTLTPGLDQAPTDPHPSFVHRPSMAGVEAETSIAFDIGTTSTIEQELALDGEGDGIGSAIADQVSHAVNEAEQFMAKYPWPVIAAGFAAGYLLSRTQSR
jgi:hypothetical protein